MRGSESPHQSCHVLDICHRQLRRPRPSPSVHFFHQRQLLPDEALLQTCRATTSGRVSGLKVSFGSKPFSSERRPLLTRPGSTHKNDPCCF